MEYFVLFGGCIIVVFLAIAAGFFEFIRVNRRQDEEIILLKREIVKLNDHVKMLERKGGAVKVYNASRKRYELHGQTVAE